jgi:hypothetical protein
MQFELLIMAKKVGEIIAQIWTFWCHLCFTKELPKNTNIK